MNRRTFLASVMAGSAGLLAGCMGGNEEEIESPDVVVSIVGREFDPLRVEIDPGEAVGWANESDGDHTVSSFSEPYSDSWDFNEPIEPEEEVGFQFEDEGVYLYRCTQHTRHVMCGVVLVGDVSLDETLVCE